MNIPFKRFSMQDFIAFDCGFKGFRKNRRIWDLGTLTPWKKIATIQTVKCTFWWSLIHSLMFKMTVSLSCIGQAKNWKQKRIKIVKINQFCFVTFCNHSIKCKYSWKTFHKQWRCTSYLWKLTSVIKLNTLVTKLFHYYNHLDWNLAHENAFRLFFLS